MRSKSKYLVMVLTYSISTSASELSELKSPFFGVSIFGLMLSSYKIFIFEVFFDKAYFSN